MAEKIDETLIRKIVQEVLTETNQIDVPIDFNQSTASPTTQATPAANADTPQTVDWFEHVGPAKMGVSKDEVVIAVAPAFAEVLTKTIVGIPHKDVIRQIIAGIEEEGLKARVIKVYRTSDVSFCSAAGDKLSGSGIAIGLQSKGTAVKAPEPVPAVNDQMARAQYIALAALLHIKETHQVVIGKPEEEIKINL